MESRNFIEVRAVLYKFSIEIEFSILPWIIIQSNVHSFHILSSVSKTIGYSCLPNAKDSDGLIALDLKHKIDYVKTNQQQLVENLHKILGGSPTLVVCVDGVRELPEDK